MFAITSALVIMGLTPSLPSQSNVLTYEKANGPVNWRVQGVEEPWAKQLVSSANINAFTVEAILNLTESGFEAWKATGGPHPDFESSLRARLKSLQSIYRPIYNQKKNRIIVMNSPVESRSRDPKSRVRIMLHDEGNGSYRELENNPPGANTHQKFLTVSGEDKDGFASISAWIRVHDQSETVKPVPGTKVQVANDELTVVEVRPFTSEDRLTSINREDEIPIDRTLVVLKSKQGNLYGLQATLDIPRPASEPVNRQLFVDHEGNITYDGPRITSNISHIVPFMRFHSFDESTRTVRFSSNLNMESLKGFRISANRVVQAWLDNIPLDPNPR